MRTSKKGIEFIIWEKGMLAFTEDYRDIVEVED